MLSLPSLAAQDSHSLWYSATNSPSHLTDPPNPYHGPNPSQSQSQPTSNSSTTSLLHRRHILSRTPLARLRHDEETLERRKQNVQNYGSAWIKPPGIPKSLFQLREEKREMEEHAEALRREALAQELADAEEGEGVDDLLQGGVEVEMDEVADLDDEVPDAEGTGLDADEDEENEDEEEDEDEGSDSDDVPRGVLASRMPDDVYRDALIRGEQARTTGFGNDGASTIDEEDPSQMLQEDDLVHEAREGNHDVDMDMDADLDADIPEAEIPGGYEHTDTEEELTSSDEEEESSLEEGQAMLLTAGNTASSMVRSDGTQNSMDLSSIVSRSSQIGSSPQQQRAGFDRRRSRQ